MNASHRLNIASVSQLALAVVLLASAATPAFGQEAAAEDQRAGGVDTIVVTAQFREQNLQDTPLAISAISGEMLEARSQTNIAEVANQAPSVTLKSNSAAYGPSLAANIRGVGQFDFHPALEPGVGIYVDDVYYSTLTGSILDLLDLDRVEVLRGPQGTLAGKNSIGGAVKLYSQRPRGDNTGYASLTYGSRDRVDLRAGFDVGITDTIAARLAGVSRRQDGYVDRLDYGCVNPGQGIPATIDNGNGCLLSRQGEQNLYAFRGQLAIEPSDNLEINLTGDFTREKHEIAGSVLTIAGYTGAGDINPFSTPQAYNSRFLCGQFCNYSSYESPADGALLQSKIPGQVDFTGWGLSAQIEWAMTENLQLVSITAYRAYDSIFSNEDDLSPLSHGLGGPNEVNFSSFSQEIRLNGDLADRLIEYTLGGFYQDQSILYTARQDLRYVPGSPLVFVSGDPVPAFTRALFAQATVNPFESFSIVGGLRYTEEGKDYSYRRRDRAGNLLAGQNALLDGQTGSYRGNRVDYRASAQYRFTDDMMAYVQYATGFKGGGVNPRPFAFTQVQPFGPETLETIEVGLKTQLFEDALRLNIAAFTSKYTDIQLILNSCPQFNPPPIPTTAAFPCGLPANVGTADINGLEIEANFRPTDEFTLDAAFSYLDFQYTSINPQAGGPTNPGGVQIDMISPYTPKWKWSFGAQYEIALGNNGSLTPRFDAAYQSAIFGTAINTPRTAIDSYLLANARLTWRNADEDLEASLEVTNLFDQYYYLTAFEISSQAGVANAQPGRPREWALTVKRRF